MSLLFSLLSAAKAPITPPPNSIPPIFRQYTDDNSFLKVFVPGAFVKEYQLSLVFARDDCDKEGRSNGVFRPRWNTEPAAIEKFRKHMEESRINVKVFISIGSLDSKYPFNPSNKEKWVQNAITSLKEIIQNKDHNWQVDGIDVFYKYINTDLAVFYQSVGKVIKALKDDGTISVASISPSNAVTPYYKQLYDGYTNNIDWVVYQFQYESASTPEQLVARYNDLARSFSKKKLFAGYSAQNDAWAAVLPFVFFVAVLMILGIEQGPGASICYHDFGTDP